MGKKKTVFANGRSVACKASSGKMICAFPNVCFTPPQTPPLPLGTPLPYPNTGFASKTKSGSRTVRIQKKAVMLRDRSFFEKSKGSEAGRAPKKGILTGQNTGKTYFSGWSHNVVIEGKNAVRHLDVTTFNHGSMSGNGAVWIFKDRASGASNAATVCKSEAKRVEDKCGSKGRRKCPKDSGDAWENARRFQKDPCQRASRCLLVPFKPKRGEGRCCPPQTPHHLIPKSNFYKGAYPKSPVSRAYDPEQAPCVCVEGGSYTVASHGLFHSAHAKEVLKLAPGKYTFGRACKIAAANVNEVFKSSGCSKKCIEAQLRLGGHKGVKEDTELLSTPSKIRHSKSQSRLGEQRNLQTYMNKFK